MLLNGIHALMDQEYSGDLNIVPSFGWYNPAKILSHLSEKELVDLMEGGEHSAFPAVESIRLCTKISRTMEEILHRFEYGDLRPGSGEGEFHRPRSSRRRPPPTRADREAMSIAAAQPSDRSEKPAKARPKAKSKSRKGRTGAAKKAPAAKSAKNSDRSKPAKAA